VDSDPLGMLTGRDRFKNIAQAKFNDTFGEHKPELTDEFESSYPSDDSGG
jgi:hypothetical protein